MLAKIVGWLGISYIGSVTVALCADCFFKEPVIPYNLARFILGVIKPGGSNCRIRFTQQFAALAATDFLAAFITIFHFEIVSCRLSGKVI